MFRDAFRESEYKDEFSRDGIKALFNELTNMSNITGEDIDMDIIDFVRTYSEESVESALDTYEVADIGSLQECTFAIELDNGNVLYRDF